MGIMIVFAFRTSHGTLQISKHIARYDLIFSQFYIRCDVSRTDRDTPPPPATRTLQRKKENHRSFVICPQVNCPVGAEVSHKPMLPTPNLVFLSVTQAV